MLAHFDFKTTLQASAYLLKKANAPMEYLKLLKLLYLADREMLLKHGLVITCDNYCAMKHGPVPSYTYDIIKGDDSESCRIWNIHIKHCKKASVYLVKDPGIGWLSEADTDYLDDVYNKYGSWDIWDVRDFTHTLPEWINRSDEKYTSSVSFTPIDILRENGCEDLIPTYQEHIDIARELDLLFE